MTQPRKPLPLRKIPKRGVYAGIRSCSDEWPPVWVMGRDYYGNSTQIDLHTDEAERLGKWLIKAAEYLKQREAKGKRK